MLTLLDIAKMNGSDSVVGLIDEAVRPYPEVSGMFRGKAIPGVGAARTIETTEYKTLVRTSLPIAGFRGANEGIDYTKSTYEERFVQTFYLNPRWKVDLAVAESHIDGPEACIALEGVAHTQGAFAALCKQFYYGRTSGVGHAKGHIGLKDVVNAAMIVDATGNTANTGSSVWAVKFGDQHVKWVWGKNGSLDVRDPRLETVTAGSNSKDHSAYVQELLAHAGLQVGSIYSCAQIRNLTEQDGKKLDDDLLYRLLETFPEGMEPDAIFMNKRSMRQLRESRTATNATGAPAPFVQEIEGIPLITTSAILSTEAIV